MLRTQIMRAWVGAISAVLLVFHAAASAAEEPKVSGSVGVSCSTTETGGECNTDSQVLRAFRGYALDEQSIRQVQTSDNGTGGVCSYQFDDYVEVGAGSSQTAPRTVKVVGHGRGSVHCEYEVKMTKCERTAACP